MKDVIEWAQTDIALENVLYVDKKYFTYAYPLI